MSSQALADLTGDCKGTIDSWRCGRRKPNKRSLTCLAGVLGLTERRTRHLLETRI